MAQAPGTTPRWKLEALVRGMEAMDRVILRHQKLPPAGTKRKQVEPPPCPPPSLLLTSEQRCAGMRDKGMRLYHEAMKELDEVAKSLALSNGDEHQQDMQQG